RALAAKPPEELPEALALVGFHGLCIHRAGYADRAAGLEARLADLLGPPAEVSPDGRMSFFPLLEYSARLRDRLSAAGWEARRGALWEPLAVHWLRGFFSEEWNGTHRWHWCGADGSLALVNLSSRPRRAALRLFAGTYMPGEAHLRIEGAGLSEDLVVT